MPITEGISPKVLAGSVDAHAINVDFDEAYVASNNFRVWW